MNKLKLLFTLLFISCLIINPAFSQENEDQKEGDKEKVFKFREIVVKEKKEQPGVVSILTEKDVKRSTKTDLIGVISENIPSFHTGSRGLMGYGVAGAGSAKMTIRGVGLSSWGPTSGLPLLINGMDTICPIWVHPVADIFTMKNIERIEVLHGPQPVIFGSMAISGVINVITKRQEVDGHYTEISMAYGSSNTTDDYIIHQGKMGIFDYGVSYNFQHTDGHREEKIAGEEYTSEYRSQNGTARIGLEIGKYFYANINGYIMDMEIHDPGPEDKSTAPDDIEVFNIKRGGTALNIHNSFNKLEGYLQIYANQGKHEAENADEKTYEHEDLIFGGKLQETLKLFTGNKITAGAEFKKYGGTMEDPTTNTKVMDEDYMSDRSVFGLVEQKLFDMFIISCGARYTDNTEYGGYTAWQGGIIINPTKTTKLYANAAKGFNIPGVRYRFNKYPPWIDEDTELEPEILITYEAGIEQTLFESLTIGIAGYKIYTRDKIIMGGAWPNIQWENSEDDIDYNGIEASAKYTYKDIAGVRAAYSYIDHEYEDDNGKDKVLNYVPKHKGVFGVFVEMYNIYVGLNGEYIKEIYADTAAAVELDDYFILNAKVSYTLLKRYKIFVNFNNITDKEYETFEKYPMPGFNVLGGASAIF